MARRTPKSRRTASPPRARRTPVKRDSEAAVTQVQPTASTAELTETYGYVRRDLLRIAVLAVIMFAIIAASPYFLM